ncbi:hypothetical protein Dthio_PD2924 [Desulfonatronospira thiodismutans ASO3-1]|uniref:Uncharacterized protein n=1 Tax=Desulfonatronospira thiodismutans ASO3-1 TaxID=555779 RepID=D6SLE0_9BACT|nr:hypothetical protein Dthio_PD2924 [Desulfonatronospira thiodismutans ASO3-1]
MIRQVLVRTGKVLPDKSEANKQEAREHLVSGNCLYLTPGLYVRLDNLVREHAGMFLEVFDLDERRSGVLEPMDWANCSPAGSDRYRRSSEKVSAEITAIEIANKIPLDEIRSARRLELDLVRDIPLELFYEWLVWHEIHHSVHDDPVVAAGLDNCVHPEIKSAGDRIKIMQAMELEADRASFNRLFPERTLKAATPAGIKKVRSIEPYLVLLHEIRAKRGIKRK